jgi:ATP-dependent DNA helicase RecG
VEKGGASAPDSVEDFLKALRPPLEFLATAPPSTASRTRVPAHALAERGRALQARTGSALQREWLEAVCRDLERYENASPQERGEIIRHCRALLDRFGEKVSAPAVYRGTSGDPSALLQLLRRPAQYVRGVGPRRAELLQKMEIETIEDLLYHLPFRYEDRRRVLAVRDARVGEDASFIGEIVQLNERRVGRVARRILEGALKDDSGFIGLTWYHQVAYFRNRFRLGQRYLVHGRVERAPTGGKRIVHPEMEIAPEGGEGQGILPVYNKPTTMTVGAMRKIVQQAVREFAPQVPSVIPDAIARSASIVDLPAALLEVHCPEPEADVERLGAFRSQGHRSLVFDELFFLQLGMLLRRRSIAREKGIALSRRGRLTDNLRLPFPLTAAQQRVIKEIYSDMAQPHPMNRLLQGDVGSGKTVVALFAALVAMENGYQAAFMAPTELLAEQHFRTISTLSKELGVRVQLLTGEQSRSERDSVYEQLADGRIQLAVGTHALIQENVRFRALGLGVVDEQHRFGVLQRAALRELGGTAPEARTPDILLMSATPIPRSLAMTLYGDLDISVLDELPPGRKPVRTLVYSEAERARVYELVRRELAQGRQGYVVYPLVESSEKEDLRDATTMARELGASVFPDHRVGLLHGKMKPAEKDAVMRRFRAGDLQLLVSTTVIEVGVDIPNATIMVIEHAERFGLSQLHQLRGRVGRGGSQATCILVAPYRRGEDVYERLKVMTETNDGFRIAEKDLELRGPGDFLGTRQSGLPDFRVVNLIRDSRLLAEARRAVESWLATDPTLGSPESDLLKAVLLHRWSGRLSLAEIG